MTVTLKIWFFGTGPFGSVCLKEIAERVPVDLVVTVTPERSGRGLKSRPSPVERTAVAEGLAVVRSRDVNTDSDLLRRFEEDPPGLILVVDFGQIVKEPYLSLEPVGCLNIHPSLLPEYRGAAPVQRAIMEGETKTGVTVFRLVEEMDAGPIAMQEELPIPGDATAGEMLELLALRGSRIFINALELIQRGALTFSMQDHEKATYARKIRKEEAHLSWERPARKVHDTVRALNPAPGAYVTYRGKRLKIWRTETAKDRGEPGRIVRIEKGFPVVACAFEAVFLRQVQSEGKACMDGDAWLRGTGLKEGDLLK
jgi:methionyl-tRNA formyltransferase